MDPQFKDACLAAALIMAYDQGMPGEEAAFTARESYTLFEQSGFAFEDGSKLSPEDAADFLKWWDSLSDKGHDIVCCGEDITEPNSPNIALQDKGTVMEVPRVYNAILCALFEPIGR